MARREVARRLSRIDEAMRNDAASREPHAMQVLRRGLDRAAPELLERWEAITDLIPTQTGFLSDDESRREEHDAFLDSLTPVQRQEWDAVLNALGELGQDDG